MLTLRETHGHLGQAKVVEHRPLYKIDDPVQSSLSSSLVINSIQYLTSDSNSRALKS